MKLKLANIWKVACHTDNVGAGTIFVAIKGQKKDGMDFISLAIEKGAKKIVIQEDSILDVAVEKLILESSIEVLKVSDARLALAQLSAEAYGFPVNKLKILGITGTKGKTTTTFVLEHILKAAGYKTAMLGTVQNKILDNVFNTNLTTRQPDYLQMFLSECVSAGVEYVVMETAAQAFSLHRVHGIQFDGAIFTNFSLEHSEFYPSMQEYFEAKKKIFSLLKNDAVAFVNADDKWCNKLRIEFPNVKTFALKGEADYTAVILQNNFKSLAFEISFGNVVDALEFNCDVLIGEFNVYNLLGAVSLCKELGVSMNVCQKAVGSLPNVPGRLEKYELSNGAVGIVDYAHNPSSFQAVLSTLRRCTNNLVVVFGAGGERDITKRPIMGATAARYADHIILTSDNPRSEDPQEIIDQILVGMDSSFFCKVDSELDRKLAIQKAFDLTNEDSILVVLGKGPDEYQDIKGVKTFFSDVQVIKSL
ncbi:MAG: UDP-N-acetylmuramoyl-L-alanyl-D-glutamate-2,6-diaminopimelate ligase [candidate division TM6 bacterium GW2011_GWF2_32_72]|nr:MAG: UDP-N-acetylmuramoyl-L-alanyl-D-glutamate-2,6-diaminopimelate ligase [candidate division TM6 bacterium GW2011_GWF2_32_72]